MARPSKRGELSKLNLAEHYYRGGVQVGYEQALRDIGAALELAGAHVSELEKWATSDPALERDPPALALETAAIPRDSEICRLTD